MMKIKKPFKKCIEIAKQIAKERDGYKCLKCGRTKEQGWQIHGSHIIGVGASPRMAVYPLNIKALCANCHTSFWHSNPTKSGLWFTKKYPEWAKDLEKLRFKVEGDLKKTNYEKKLVELKEELKTLLDE